MMTFLEELLKPFFKKTSRADTTLSLFTERSTCVIFTATLFYVICSADLSELFFLKDRLFVLIPLLMLFASFWYVLRDSSSFRFNPHVLLFLPFFGLAYYSERVADDGSIIFLVAYAGICMAFILIHMLRLNAEFSFLMIVLGIVCIYCVMMGILKFTAAKTWVISNDIAGYYLNPFIRGGFLGNVGGLSALLCAVLPFPIAVITARNFKRGQKVLACAIFGAIWAGVSRTCDIFAISIACLLLLSAPFMYIGSRRRRYKLLAWYGFFALTTLAIFALDRRCSYILAETDFDTQFALLFNPLKDAYASLASAPMLGVEKYPDIPCSFVEGFYRFGWLGMLAICLPVFYLIFKTLFKFLKMDVEQWPMSVSVGRISGKERKKLMGRIRHSALNRSITPPNTIRTGAALSAFCAYTALAFFTDAINSYATCILYIFFAALIMKLSYAKYGLTTFRLPARFITAFFLICAAIFCVAIPYMDRMGY